MKKHFTTAAAIALSLALAACHTTEPAETTGTALKAQTPAQVAAQVCPPVQAALTGLQALSGLPLEAMTAINTAIPVVNGVCAASATVNLASLQTLQQTALPAILNAVKASALSAERQNAVVVDITAANLIVTAFVQAQQNIARPATVTAPVTAAQ